MFALVSRFSDRSIRLFISTFIFAICVAVSPPRLHSVDEISMFVTAVNAVNRGAVHTDQIGWAQWLMRPGEQVGMVTGDGDIYSKKSPLVILFMMPLVALGEWVPSLGLTRAVLLLGPAFTALTAGLLYHLGRSLGYSRFAAILAASSFGLSTMALVSSRAVMGEPIASFGLLLALSGLQGSLATSPDSPRERTSLLPALQCGLGLALAIGVNAVYVALIPVFAIALLVSAWKQISAGKLVWQLACFGLPVLLVGAGLAAYNFLRFGSILQTGYNFGPGQEGFTTPVLWGILGLTLSPARGFVWYNPPAFLALVGWPFFHRQHRLLSWTMLVVVGIQLVAFGSWWEWWGGYAWGPRFLVPVIPYVLLACLPVFEAIPRGSPRPDRSGFRYGGVRRVAGLGVMGILLAGFAVQIAGAVIDYNLYEVELDARDPAPAGQPFLYLHNPNLVYDVARSPIVVHFQRLLSSPPDLAWWPGAQKQTSIPDVISAIQSKQRSGDVVVYVAPELLNSLLEARSLPPTYGLPLNLPDTDGLAQKLFARALRDARRVWLITWYPPADPGNWYEAQLRETWASGNEVKLDGYRLVLFVRPPQDIATQPVDYSFGPIRLTGYRVQTGQDELLVQLKWTVTSIPQDDYVAFVHLVDRDGSLIAQQDRQPLGGYRPTRTWQPSETIVDRFVLPIADRQLAGAHIEVGWYSWPSLQRLRLVSNLGDHMKNDILVLEPNP